MKWADQQVEMPVGSGSRDARAEASRIQANVDLGYILREVAEAVEAWQGPISAAQLLRMREAADALHRTALDIGEENWERFGHE